MNMTIVGLSRLQCDLADRLWACDTEQDIEALMQSLPVSLRRQAAVVRVMITAAELDHIEEVDAHVAELCRSW